MSALFGDDFISLTDVTIYPIEGGQPIVRDFVCVGSNCLQAAHLMADIESI